MGRSGGDVVVKPKEVFELVADCGGYFDSFGVRFQGMLQEGEAATTTWHCEAHATELA